jgi:Asp-tRNA(Asn)/Glu-tRNA(Gln) amidotransferase A subunit family amidase
VRPGEESDRGWSLDGVVRDARAIEAGSSGLPIGVQVVARPWREDVALAVMAALEKHFRQQADYPSGPPL